MKSNLTTLCYIEKNNCYLMLHRIVKKNDVNKDKWIGIGGHFEYGESPEDCLIREALEETGLKLTSYQFRGIVTFISDDYPAEYMCLYTCDAFEGDIGGCNEGTLEWVPKEAVDALNLWEGDRIFFALLDDNAPFFSLKLRYRENILKEAVLNGKPMELLDIVDENGRPTGQVRERTLMHRTGTPHATAHLWIVRKNSLGSYDILLQKRAAQKDSFPGCYDISSAGHIPAGSDPKASAVRELKEELGMSADPDDFIEAGIHDGLIQTEFNGKPFHNREISTVYIYESAIDDSKLSLQPEEVAAVCWMDYFAILKGMEAHTLNHCIFPDEFELIGKTLGLL